MAKSEKPDTGSSEINKDRGGRLLAILVATFFVLTAAAIALPDDAYQRSQLLDATIHRRAHWIYERIHFDPTPIDVVVLGPSRVGAGVNAPLLQATLAAHGLSANVVNFAFPETGRDINYAVLEDTLTTKTPKLVIIGVIEQPARFGHSAFRYVARRGLVLDPAYPTNSNWLNNVSYLPFRQMKLFVARLAPGLMGMPRDFDPAHYWGSNYQTTGDVMLPGGTIKEGDIPGNPAELRRGVAKLEATIDPRMLPISMSEVEFGDERTYTRRLAEIALNHGAKVAFLFIPYYTGPTVVQEQAFYRQYGPVWNAGFVSTHTEWFADYGHLTSGGARALTDWIAPRAAAELKPQKAAR